MLAFCEPNYYNMETLLHENFMKEALLEAEQAAALGEVPVGCVIVKDGEIIARAHNMVETDKHPLAHAEIIAIDEAVKKLGWRLAGCDMYVTLAPRDMCKGAISWARLEHVYIGTEATKGSDFKPQFVFGILHEECYNILVSFFKELRNNK